MVRISHDASILPVILGGDIGAYAIGREFHEAYGCKAISLIQEPIGIIKHSRIFEHVRCTTTEPEEICDHVRRIAVRNRDKTVVLITNSEPCIPAVNAAKAQIEGIVSPTPSAEVIAQVSNKNRFNELCRAHGLDTPATELVRLAGNEPIAPSKIAFPLVAKPAYSPEYAGFINMGFKKVYFIERQEQLDELWAKLRDAGFAGNFLVQELIGGDDTYMDSVTLYIDSHGKTTMFGGAQVLLEDHAPSMLGNPVAMITQPMEDVWDKCAHMLTSIGYRGFANFDIKRDPATGRRLFLEVNPRIGRNSFYNCAAGANPMAFCVEDLVCGQDVEPVRITNEILYSLVPTRLLRRYVRDPELLARVDRLVSQNLVFDPQRYAADRSLRRMVDVELTENNQYRKFARYYPEPTETSF
ncbi:ATP-grasp domain-containing protein [Collinsella tanakaei]|uniref:carboxylate--amine ligase n=1 Tax=Collinsella tanakaei TaxID=626935 RepID=UPI0029433624|nr:ATP-grasp domain-containing protein [Collinsella tanakaei]